MSIEKMMPRNLAAEEAVVGSLILDPDVIVKIAGVLLPSDFHSTEMANFYQGALDMYKERRPVDVLSLSQQVGNDKLIVRLTELANRTPTATHVEYWAHDIIDCALRRALISAGGFIAALGYETDAEWDDLLAKAQGKLYEATSRNAERPYHSLEEMAFDFQARLELLESSPDALAGIPTGLDALDQATGGMMPGEMLILAGRPGTGKTSLALSVAYNAARRQKSDGDTYRVGMFSLEMSREELMNRLVSMEAPVDGKRLRVAKFLSRDDYGRIGDAVGRLSSVPLFIDDQPGLTIGEMRNRAHRMRAEAGVDLLVIDYLQKARSPRKDGNRFQEVGEIARGLKDLSRELRVPVLSCAQLNREPENRPNRVPLLSDLGESGDIEREADIVLFIVRPDMYDETAPKGVAELHIAKHRNGAQGVLKVGFDAAHTTFRNLTYRDVNG